MLRVCDVELVQDAHWLLQQRQNWPKRYALPAAKHISDNEHQGQQAFCSSVIAQHLRRLCTGFCISNRSGKGACPASSRADMLHPSHTHRQGHSRSSDLYSGREHCAIAASCTLASAAAADTAKGRASPAAKHTPCCQDQGQQVLCFSTVL